MKNLIVVSNKTQIPFFADLGDDCKAITADEYLKNESEENGQIRVFNLCNDYSYCKRGYYVSLLAEARKQRPLPSVSSISDLQNKDSLKILSESISSALQKALKDIKGEEFEISIYFGKNIAAKYNSLAKQIFNFVHAPLIRVFCYRKNDEWRIKSLNAISFNEVPKAHYSFLQEAIREFFGSSPTFKKLKTKSARFDIAILVNEEEELPPSNAGAIKLFLKAAKDLRMNAELIGPKDISLLSRFDALFIRETTSVFDHTYKFAKRAELEGLVVMDDPQSILRCCNKVYLHDMLAKKNLSTPKTWIIHKDTELDEFKDFPLIIKKPDSAFSAGVKKVKCLDDLKKQAAEYFKKSDLLILQEFLQTDFDWRIGVVDNELLYACRYHMAEGHWQIIDREGGKTKEGSVDCLPLSEVPNEVLKLAQKACKEIGNSLYGVDIKEKDGQYYIIEINDNPSIEKSYEDRIIGYQLYSKIMSVFLQRLESR
ncbi:MAG: RimK family protein [Bdellovibrionota bacterium]|nr:RimK family protein [Bdellovibrionota bacterium]